MLKGRDVGWEFIMEEKKKKKEILAYKSIHGSSCSIHGSIRGYPSIQPIEAVFTRSTTVNLEFVTGFAANTLLPRTDISKSLETSRGGYMYARTPKGTCI